MINESPADILNFEEFWDWGQERQDEYISNSCGAPKDGWLTQVFARECHHIRNIEIWQICRSKKTKIKQLEPYFDIHKDGVGRKLKNGTVDESELWVVCIVSGLDPQVVMVPPTGWQQFQGRTRTVEIFRHNCRTPDLPLVDRVRIEESHISAAHAALIHAIIHDGKVTENWRFLLIPQPREISQMLLSREITELLCEIFDSALRLVQEDSASVDCLRRWHPRAVGPAEALGRIAQVWNPYQLHWLFAHESINSLSSDR